ncbi:MAG: lamin tail domain-containing protein, partial [Treponema sp.]|nr:lamin tail domain-containing protein [Treponema sp.]
MNKFVYVFCALLSLLLLSCTGNTAGLPDTRNAELVNLTIAGKAVELAQPAADAVSAGMAGVTLTEAEAAAAAIEYTAKSGTALVRYCRVASGDTVLAWKRSGAVNFFNEDIFVIQVSSGASVLYYKVQIQIETTPFEPPAENTGDLCGKVLILQAYGTGSKNDGGVSHSFIELYNKSGSEADLSGYTLQYSQGGVNWTVMDLSGRKIPSGCSFLVLGKQMNARSDLAGTGLLQLDPAHADMVFPDLQIDNNEFKIFLVQGTDALAVRNPFDVKGNRSGVKADGYTDLLGVNDTDETKSIDAFETSELTNAAIQAPYYASKGKSIRRITLIDTDDNSRDFQRVEWRTNQAESISPAEFEAFRPRSTKDGAWDPV